MLLQLLSSPRRRNCASPFSSAHQSACQVRREAGCAALDGCAPAQLPARVSSPPSPPHVVIPQDILNKLKGSQPPSNEGNDIVPFSRMAHINKPGEGLPQLCA